MTLDTEQDIDPSIKPQPKRRRKFGEALMGLVKKRTNPERQPRLTNEGITEIHMPPSLERKGYMAYTVEAAEGQTMYFETVAPRQDGDFTVFKYRNDETGEEPWYVFKKVTNVVDEQGGLKGYILREKDGARVVTDRPGLSSVVPDDTGDGKFGLGYRLDGIANSNIQDKLKELVVIRQDEGHVQGVEIPDPEGLKSTAEFVQAIESALDAYENPTSTAA